jgi:hypothetical protein
MICFNLFLPLSAKIHEENGQMGKAEAMDAVGETGCVGWE